MFATTQKLRTIIIDDEPMALRVLETHAEKLDFLEVLLATTNALEGLLFAQQEAVDVIFLDIQMPDLTGIQFMELLAGRSKVILTTAYSQYALQGYTYDVVDYLVKPISFDHFLRAIQKVQRLMPNGNPLAQNEQQTSAVDLPEIIFIKTEYKLVKVEHDNLLYFQGGKDYTTIFMQMGQLLSLTSLSKFEESLPPSRFVRVHKSYLVAISKIGSIERQRIFLGKNTIPIGDAYKDDVMKRFGL